MSNSNFRKFMIKHPALQAYWLIARVLWSFTPFPKMQNYVREHRWELTHPDWSAVGLLFMFAMLGLIVVILLFSFAAVALCDPKICPHTPTTRELQATIEAMQAVMTKVAPR